MLVASTYITAASIFIYVVVRDTFKFANGDLATLFRTHGAIAVTVLFLLLCATGVALTLLRPRSFAVQ